MAETKVLIEWLDAICEEAKVAGQNGDPTKARSLAHNGALQYYFNNVYMLPNQSRATFQAMPAYMKEVERLYEVDQQAMAAAAALAENTERTKAQGERIAEMDATLKLILERLKNPVVKKPKGKTPEPPPEDEEGDEDEG